MGEVPTLTWGTAKHEYDGEILDCLGKHWIPDPILFGAVGIPNQKSISLPCFVDMLCLCVFWLFVLTKGSDWMFERRREFGFRMALAESKVESKRVF
jgi:hypothetical protein